MYEWWQRYEKRVLLLDHDYVGEEAEFEVIEVLNVHAAAGTFLALVEISGSRLMDEPEEATEGEG